MPRRLTPGWEAVLSARSVAAGLGALALGLTPGGLKRLLLLYRWKTGVCLPCVDELAEKGGIRYRPENLEATTWADLPAKRPGRTRRR